MTTPIGYKQPSYSPPTAPSHVEGNPYAANPNNSNYFVRNRLMDAYQASGSRHDFADWQRAPAGSSPNAWPSSDSALPGVYGG